MTDAGTYRQIERLRWRAHAFGYQLGTTCDAITLRPLEERWPGYARDHMFRFSSFERVDGFLDGIEAAHYYQDLTK